MREVDLYIESNMSIASRTGNVMYILAYTGTSGKTADIRDTLHFEDSTMNSAVLSTINTALSRIHEPCKLRLWLDNEYIAGTIESGRISEWQRNGWKNSRGKEVDQEWVSLEGFMRNIEIEVQLKAHHSYKDWMARTIRAEENQQKTD